MDYPHIPLHNPHPNCQRFIDIIMGRADGSKPPLVEYIIDELVMQPILTGLLGREWTPYAPDHDAMRPYLDNVIAFWHAMGYDCLRWEIGMGFQEKLVVGGDPSPGASRQRAWTDQHHGAIASWEDFERYPWPNAENVDLFALEYLNSHLPDGMGFITCHAGGPFEHISQIMSIETLCIKLLEDPGLVQAVSDKVGECMEAYYRRLLGLDRLAALFQGDDMGFRTGTLIDPDHLRQYSLPWHKRFADMAHAHGIPYFLHSCGCILEIMDDLINDAGIDAKHSYEDAIIPVEVFQERYGHRIGVLGGVDLNILSGAPVEAVRARVRQLLEVCGARGRYALGAGNSVPSYVPVENYLSMVDEVHRFACE